MGIEERAITFFRLSQPPLGPAAFFELRRDRAGQPFQLAGEPHDFRRPFLRYLAWR